MLYLEDLALLTAVFVDVEQLLDVLWTVHAECVERDSAGRDEKSEAGRHVDPLT